MDTIELAKIDLVIANRAMSRLGAVDAYGHVSVRHPLDPRRFPRLIIATHSRRPPAKCALHPLQEVVARRRANVATTSPFVSHVRALFENFSGARGNCGRRIIDRIDQCFAILPTDGTDRKALLI